MDAGDIIFNFKGNTDDVEKKTSQLGSKVKSMSKGFLKGTAVVSGALAGLTAKSVQMAGDLEQQIGGTEAVFGKFASRVQDYSKEAFKTAGLSANDYMANINKMGALMQGSGIDIEKSLELSAKAMQRASDVASIMGIDINSAMESIAGASKGNFTMMDNLGVAMNATTIEAYAMSKGINKTYNEMTKAEQVEMAMQMFLEKTSYAMGNYAKENETFAGSLQTMKASISNLMAGTGDLDQVIQSVSNFGNIVVKSIGEMAPKVVNGIVGLINGLIPMLPTLMQNLLPSVINGAIMLVQGIVNSLPMILTTLASMLPTIITSVLNGLIQITNSLTGMLPVLIPQIVDAILGLIPILIDNLPLFIRAGWQLITGLTIGIIRSVPTLLSHIPMLIKSIFGYFKQMPKMAIDVGKNLVKGLWNGIKDVTGWVLNKVKGFGKSILKGIKGIFGIKSPSKEFEYIGKMNILGFEKPFDEQKDELQSKFESLFDLSPNLYGTSSLNLSPNVNVYVENNMKEDRLGQLVNKVKTFSGGAKNDYSYGMGA